MGKGCDLEWRSVWEEARDSLGLDDCGRIVTTAAGTFSGVITVGDGGGL